MKIGIPTRHILMRHIINIPSITTLSTYWDANVLPSHCHTLPSPTHHCTASQLTLVHLRHPLVHACLPIALSILSITSQLILLFLYLARINLKLCDHWARSFNPILNNGSKYTHVPIQGLRA